jgi:hypothetical protein
VVETIATTLATTSAAAAAEPPLAGLHVLSSEPETRWHKLDHLLYRSAELTAKPADLGPDAAGRPLLLSGAGLAGAVWLHLQVPAAGTLPGPIDPLTTRLSAGDRLEPLLQPGLVSR